MTSGRLLSMTLAELLHLCLPQLPLDASLCSDGITRARRERLDGLSEVLGRM
jgi:hypothetical protein